MKFRLLITLAALLISHIATAQDTVVYFLAAGPKLSQPQDNPRAPEYESFVVPVSDPNTIATIRSLIQRAKYPVVNVRIKAGSDGINRDYYAPGAPAWNWSVVQLLSIQGEPYDVFPVEHPTPPEEKYGSASMIAADPDGWIAKHGDQLALQWFPLTTEVDPAKLPVRSDATPVMSNLSTRGITAQGQDVMIGGISISGPRPKQVAIRCSGENLLQPRGVLTRVASPRIRMFASDGRQLAELFNQRQYELAARFSALTYPGVSGDTLAIVTLYPGQYTFQAYDQDGRTGVVLFDTYDLSLAPQPFP